MCNECKSRHCLQAPRVWLAVLYASSGVRQQHSDPSVKDNPLGRAAASIRDHLMSEAGSFGIVFDAAALRWHSEAFSVVGSHGVPLLTIRIIFAAHHIFKFLFFWHVDQSRIADNNDRRENKMARLTLSERRERYREIIRQPSPS